MYFTNYLSRRSRLFFLARFFFWSNRIIARDRIIEISPDPREYIGTSRLLVRARKYENRRANYVKRKNELDYGNLLNDHNVRNTKRRQ